MLDILSNPICQCLLEEDHITQFSTEAVAAELIVCTPTQFAIFENAPNFQTVFPGTVFTLFHMV